MMMDDVKVDKGDTPETIRINSCAFEVKVLTIDTRAINECVYNMFGTGTSLVIRELQLEKVVESATV